MLLPKEIWSALIGAGATICAVSIPLAVNWGQTRRETHLSARRKALLGDWIGEASEYLVEDAQIPLLTNVKLTVNFTRASRKVRATALMHDESPKDDRVIFEGEFYSDDFLQLFYRNESYATRQFGTIILRLDPTGTELNGFYNAFSPKRNTIASGKVSLTKR